ncbi:hypothetical protein NEOLEDRAFT_1055714 [Neolentinus lepideus HHB14362 ss-1]|uniref:Conidiation protein 6 n=1 Tax=Neolentinus lepideus HHB14362 ss-1 TaxID=1314782 RepID=A0A165VGP7_9AGAM|nr:hypothetical protein NEOLEDRAFT_1055714 [Neolentinus lepideus HHB14362 ss-1]
MRLQAAIKNPNVSNEAKERSQHIFEDMESQPEEVHYPMKDEKSDTRVNAGYKATMKNPNVSTEAKENAEQILEERGAI